MKTVMDDVDYCRLISRPSGFNLIPGPRIPRIQVLMKNRGTRLRMANNASTSLTSHLLLGEISKVVYESERDNYKVIRVTDDRGGKHTAVGLFFGAFAGQGIEIRGRWETHKEHGRQLRAESYKYILPTTAEGIKRYLASGIVKGLGPKTAAAIVDRFGLKTIEILDNHSARLREVPGLGRKRLKEIRDGWKEQTANRETLIFLQGLGISPAYCARIIKKFGDDAAAVVRDNPFILADEIDGIGFLMADRIAASLGITGEAPERLVAGIAYALGKIAQDGHVCYPAEELTGYAAELLGIPENEAKRAVALCERQGAVVIDDCEFAPPEQRRKMIYSARHWGLENELATLVKHLSAPDERHAGRRIKGGLTTDTPFSEEQLESIRNVRRHPFTVITGGPGVGKTTVVGEIVRQAVKSKLKVYLAAPTGRAAKRMSETCRRPAMTIHRMLKWDPAERGFAYGYKTRLPCDILIVDETSMLDLHLATALLRSVAKGTAVVMVGDPDQLPSVGPGSILKDIIASKLCPTTNLSRIYRQDEGSDIIDNAHRINRGALPEVPSPDGALSDFYWIERGDPVQARETIAKMVTERIPAKFGFNPYSHIQVLTPMNKGECGTVALNQTLQEILNGDPRKPRLKFGDKTFKSGDRVMQIRNNYDKNVFNGDMGRIASINGGDKNFTIDFDGNHVKYEFNEADQITLAYAVTIHKSQGSEFPAVVVPILNQHFIMLRRNLLYTAVTRAKKLLILIGTRKAVSMAVSNFRVEPRFSMLLAKLRALKKRGVAMSD